MNRIGWSWKERLNSTDFCKINLPFSPPQPQIVYSKPFSILIIISAGKFTYGEYSVGRKSRE